MVTRVFVLITTLRWLIIAVIIRYMTEEKFHLKELRSETIFDNWKPFRNDFYSTLKALFVLKIVKFLSWLFGHVEKTARVER